MVNSSKRLEKNLIEKLGEIVKVVVKCESFNRGNFCKATSSVYRYKWTATASVEEVYKSIVHFLF